ncbi:formimidoylglutamate deiminase [Vibrio diazotrophicus]|uniref:Formimidoylglutamate deiminase n=1 Tax=Vibrio diazotrophicus TaxID=685 RepID=A0A2J8I8I7_VIBDI|nr:MULTISPECIES: formimidoylglutamate deiminase [Vibrio]MCF7361998.1 formimidoylglutamate deiminase [Vibrio sp. A1-b2]PNI06852.1 formimidoylglutamate deiminase [Vibrio diazotrophicus]
MTGTQTRHYFFAERAWLADGWHNNVSFEVTDGVFTHVESDTSALEGATKLIGPVLPTLANVHSHAFQRVMAGMAEVCLNPNDSFWSWRDLMYKIVQKLSPEQANVIATQLYIDMLKAGYTQVGEFHYLHHDVAGKHYANRAEMSHQLINAADRSGIGLTLLPVLYSHSGFGAQAPNEGQARFINSSHSYLELQSQCEQALAGSKLHNLGICFHSLRAVTEQQIKEVLSSSDSNKVVHIHISEQQKEVNDCLAWSGQRPVEWLHEHVGLNERWNLIHATHLNEYELNAIASSKAVVGLCPTTEANLGDGIFPGVEFERLNGRWGIGSDSHVSLSIVEELRILEYGQRLRDQQRNRLYRGEQTSIGDNLFKQALLGGNQSCGVELGLSVGQRADFMVLDDSHPFIGASETKDVLNRWLFACSENVVKDVFVAGKQVISEGRHELDVISRSEFSKVIKKVIYDV